MIAKEQNPMRFIMPNHYVVGILIFAGVDFLLWVYRRSRNDSRPLVYGLHIIDSRKPDKKADKLLVAGATDPREQIMFA